MNDSNKHKIVFLELAPGGGDSSAIAFQGREIANIRQEVDESNTNSFEVKEISENATFAQAGTELLRLDPDIIHLSGHGSTHAFYIPNYSDLDDQGKAKLTGFSQDQINEIFGPFLRRDKPCILFVNACLAGNIAKKLVASLSDSRSCCVIGMTNALNRVLALDFAKAFYIKIMQGYTVEVALSAIEQKRLWRLEQEGMWGDKEALKQRGFYPQPVAYGNKKIKFDIGVNRSIDIDWHRVSVEQLKQQQSLTTNFMASGEGITYQVNQVFVPPELIEHKKLFCRKEAVSSERESEPSQKVAQVEVTHKFEYDKFLDQVLKHGKSPKSHGNRIAIVGEQGVGKTTILQQIEQWVLAEFPESIVIWVALATLKKTTLKTYLDMTWLPGVIEEEIGIMSDEYRHQFMHQCRQGRVWLLLDGLDEIPITGNPLSALKQDLRGWLKQTRIVLTCQSNVWDGNRNVLESFDTYRPLGFVGKGQVEEFIRKWFIQRGDSAIEQGQKLYLALQEPGKSRVRDLVKNPLRLTLLCFYWFRKKGKLPETQAELYKAFADRIYQWKSEEFRKMQVLNQALAELSKTAIDDPTNQGIRFQLRQDFVEGFLNAPLPNSEKTLFEMALQLGWLNQIGVDADDPSQKVYAFYHSTFQEYFAALAINKKIFFLNHISKNPDSQEASYRVFEPQWKQVFLLWLGRQGGELEQHFKKEKQKEADLNEQKEALLQTLTTFKDECKNFYSGRAFLLAAEGIAEFKDCAQADIIVKQILQWEFGYSRKEVWLSILSGRALKSKTVWLETIINNTDSQRVIMALVKLLDTTQDEDTRRKTAAILSNIDPGNETAICALEQLLDTTQNESIRQRTASTLGIIDPGNETAIRSLEQFLDATQDEDTHFMADTRFYAAQDLGYSIDPGNKTAIRTLEQLLDTVQSKFIRFIIADSLGSHVDPGNETAIWTLLQLLDTTQDSYIRCSTVRVLGRIARPGNEMVIRALVKLLDNTQDESIHSWVVDSLGEIGVGNEMAIRALVKFLDTTHSEYNRRRAAKSLGTIDPGNKTATRKLEQLLVTTQNSSPRNEDMRCRAAARLGTIDPGNKTAIRTLEQLLDTTQDESMRGIAADFLVTIDPENEAAIRTLMKLLDITHSEYNRMSAAKALVIIDSENETVIRALEQLLGTTRNELVCRSAAETLVTIDPGNESVIRALIQLLGTTRDEYTRRKYADSLGIIDPRNKTVIKALVQSLRKHLRSESNQKLMITCAQALSYPEFYQAFRSSRWSLFR
ncbi:MAG: HEAT repeat domain-containing protein [Cyanobacteria bacterium J06560_6]